MSGCDIRLVFTLSRPVHDSILNYKKCVHLWNNFPCISTLFQTINYVRSNNLNLKYQKSKSSGCQDIGIRKLNLWQRLNRLNSFPNISVNFKGKNFVDQILEIPRLLNCDTAELCLQNNLAWNKDDFYIRTRHLIPVF